ncbi:uncharacterized protein AKAME5_002385200 [Lates japonicus]|uniref:Uncharacterized protein n=1 Tax=Lates japonicus TaxID=270547 RepID=A0AAD3RL39_LATJO|nr:uncharacterized protein AKAME5_002385200 [Lates japonicus]
MVNTECDSSPWEGGVGDGREVLNLSVQTICAGLVLTPIWRGRHKLNYTACNGHVEKDEHSLTSMQLDVIPHCKYCMTIKAKYRDLGSTALSDEKCFDAETDPIALVYAAIIIPLIFAGLATLTFVCCKRNKEHIFPKVPQPRDLLSDISDNNNKSTVYNLYIPAEEEENCKITLVMDPQINKPGC